MEEQKIINSDDQPKLYNKKDQDTGKKKQKKTFILIFAAVMLILLGILLYCLPTILQNMNPVFRTQTENGMTVEIDREKGTVTLLDVGSAADELIVSLDETVTAERYGRMDGTYDLTKIAAGAFRDRSTMYRLILPSTVTVIEDGAFNHCDHLRFMTISSSVSMDSGAFVDMEKPLIWRKDSSLSVPQGFESYTYGEETRYGKLIDLSYDEQGILYGRTDQNSAVVLDIPGELNEFVLDDLSTECLLKGMTDNAMDTLDMPRVYVNCESFLYPKELNGKAEWIFDDSENKGYNLAGSWYLSLEVTEMLSEDYGEISCSEELICAADDILNHCMNSNSEKPLEESDWGTILDEYGVDWNNAQALYEASRSADELEILYNAIETAYDAKNEGNAYNRMALIILDDGEWCESICILHN